MNSLTPALQCARSESGSREATMAIPQGVTFADLHLRADDTLDQLFFRSGPFAAVCRANGISQDTAIADGATVETILRRWYAVARAAGEPSEDVMEDLLSEEADVVEGAST